MADLVRLWTTTSPGGTLANRSIPAGTAFEVVLDVEAESAEFAAGASFTVGACAINRTTGAVSGPLVALPGTPAYGAATGMGPVPGIWNPASDQFRYTVPGAFGAANDIIEVFGFLTVGAGASVETHFASAYLIRA